MTSKLFQKLAAIVLTTVMCLAGTLASAQNRPISGTVVDGAGLPVIGATVMVVGNSSIGAVTDVNGAFSLNVPAGSNITVSCIGYATQTVPVGQQSVFNFILQEDNEFIEETVVIGYGVQRKSDLTGSVASVRSQDLTDRSVSNAGAALQGKAAGVQVYTNSGAPGEGAHIRVRGISSNSGSGLGPLLIVDGLKVDNIQYLDPEMIESMEVLKDAASAAIYGAQAGNGVVLITTKSGSKSKDGNIFYNYKHTITSLGHYAEVLNAEEFIDWQHQASQLGTREEIIGSGLWDGVTDTNWADVLYGKGITRSHTIGAQGGNDRGSYYMSLNYVDENGMARGDKDIYKRLTAQVNADYKVKSWFQVGTNTSVEHYTKSDIGSPDEYGGTLLGALIIDPLTPVYFNSIDEMPSSMRNAYENGYTVDGTHYNYNFYTNPEGKYYSTSKIVEGDGVNPMLNVARSYGTSQGWNIRGTIFANITPFKGLVYTSRLGYRIAQSYSDDFSEPYYVNAKHYSQSYSISASSSQSYYYQWENFANYNRTFGKHDIGAMAGMSYTFNDSRGVNASLSGPDPLKSYEPNFRYLSYDNGSGTKGIGGGTPSNSAQISYFGRLTYSYDNRYSLQTNFRADAFDSSKLSKKNRWGYFPSVSAGWTVSNEPWFKDNVSRNAISFLKFRGSWGVNGNISVLSGYPYSTSISYNSRTYQYHVDNDVMDYGSQPDGLANPDLTWETSVQTDLGMDLRMFNNRLTFGFDWFNKNTEGLLVRISPVAEVGISSTTVNAGSVNNNGLEFELGWQDDIGDFGYSINANFSTLNNMVTYLEPTVGHQSGSHFANYKLYTYFQEGYPVWFLRGFDYAGIGADGYAEFYDANGEITSNPTDDDLKFIGNTLPTFQYGVTVRLDWKGIDLTVFGNGSGGNYLVPCIYRTEHTKINTLRYYYENAGKTIPAIDKIYDKINFWSSSATIFKGDYFKIKQIQLGYTLPKKLLTKVGMSAVRAFVSMDDWFIFTQYPGFDPEAATTGSSTGRGLDKGNYPNSKKLMFGVNLSF
ncbi:MAG: TonB-dependent receptor [Bacteroidales bacterium]|nr:TonB-dependent receptor [Bacteroidales bacterium]